MCVIAYSSSKKNRPSLEALTACEQANPHGSGVAWISGGQVSYVKGLTPAAIHELINIVPGPVVIHFRIASVGGVHPDLCHPFPCTPTADLHQSGTADAVLFQNGTWSGWAEFAGKHLEPFSGALSDARVAAAGVGLLGSHDWLRTIPCRWVHFSARDGAVLHGSWTEIGGVQYSNTYWTPLAARSVRQGKLTLTESKPAKSTAKPCCQPKAEAKPKAVKQVVAKSFAELKSKLPKNHGVYDPRVPYVPQSLVDQAEAWLAD